MRSLVSVLIVTLVINTITFGQVTVQNNDLKHTEEIKKKISKTGASLDKVITVKLKDKSVVSGTISEIADDHFVVKANSGAPYSINYAQVEKVNVHKLNGRGFTTTPSVYKKVIGAFAIGATVIAVIGLACVASRRCVD